ncbi:hypothetical protein ABE10_02940, partial [Bacillus toyonensis]|nr:hypothetical protein [Bacillus toyonensis]
MTDGSDDVHERWIGVRDGGVEHRHQQGDQAAPEVALVEPGAQPQLAHGESLAELLPIGAHGRIGERLLVHEQGRRGRVDGHPVLFGA